MITLTLSKTAHTCEKENTNEVDGQQSLVQKKTRKMAGQRAKSQARQKRPAQMQKDSKELVANKDRQIKPQSQLRLKTACFARAKRTTTKNLRSQAQENTHNSKLQDKRNTTFTHTHAYRLVLNQQLIGQGNLRVTKQRTQISAQIDACQQPSHCVV